jgi:tRNA dimethylallyltransferase
MSAGAGLPPAVFLMGPTASGKTDLAVALVKRFPFEAISVDSALVYRGMDIGTAKPDVATLAACPHHLIDVVEPTERYSAGRFRAEALTLMADITSRGSIPLLVGGTMLYFKALKDGLDALPPADHAIRADIDARAASVGWPALHAELARLDPASAARIRNNDSQRIQRALEVFLSSGRPMSELFSGSGPALPYRLLELALMTSDRALLHRRIDIRFRTMIEGGLVDELRGLRERHVLTPDMASMRCVGYRQAWQFIEGEIDADQLFETGSAATRQLAKRQLTWLRGWQGVEYFESGQPDTVEKVSAWLENRLSEQG